MVIAGLLTLLNATGAIDVLPSTIVTSVLAVVGGGLLLSTWLGRARGLIWLGIFLLPVVAITTIADRIDLRGGFGEREYQPVEVGEVRSEYRLGAGSQTLDLTRSSSTGATPPMSR